MFIEVALHVAKKARGGSMLHKGVSMIYKCDRLKNTECKGNPKLCASCKGTTIKKYAVGYVEEKEEPKEEKKTVKKKKTDKKEAEPVG